MKSKFLNFGKLFRLAATAIIMLFFAGTVSLQTERNQSKDPTETFIKVGTATAKSPAIDLKTVSKEIVPGIFEVDPSSIRGKRLIVPRDKSGENLSIKGICIGKYKNGECIGIYIEL